MPNYPVTYWVLGLLLRKTGRYELAIAEGEKGVNLSGGSPLMRAALGANFRLPPAKEKAIEILDDLTNLAKQKYIAPYFLAGIHVGLGEDARAHRISWKNPSKSTPTGLSTFIWIPAWTPCGPTRIFKTCYAVSAFPYRPTIAI